jgi:hypothetical protein
VWSRRKTAADRQRYKTLRKQVNYLTREAKRLYMKRYLNPNLPTKTLWGNLDSVGAKTATENELVFFLPTNLIHFSHQPKTVQQETEE